MAVNLYMESRSQKAPSTEKKGVNLPEDLIDLIMDRILYKFREEKLHMRQDMTLEKLSELIRINKSYVSHTINRKQGKNYSNFINELRVREAEQLLSCGAWNHLSMAGISETVGFRSRSTFHAMFKKYTGTTPHNYMNNIQQKRA